MGLPVRRPQRYTAPDAMTFSSRTQLNVIFVVKAACSAIPTYLSRVKGKESDSGTAAHLIKRDHDE
jgi:hypothetical protein